MELQREERGERDQSYICWVTVQMAEAGGAGSGAGAGSSIWVSQVHAGAPGPALSSTALAGGSTHTGGWHLRRRHNNSL